MLKRLYYGVPAYLLINLIQPGLYYRVLANIRIELVVAVFLMIILVVSGRFRRFKLTNEPINKWMTGLIVVVFVSAIVSIDFETGWEQAFEMLKVYFLYIIIVTFSDNEKDIFFLLFILVIASFIMGYEQIFNFMHGQLREASSELRADYAIAAQGLASGHVAAANLQLQAMPITWYLGACNSNRRVAVAGLLIFLCQVFIVVISASRGGFIGLVAFMCCMTYFSSNRIKMITVSLVVLIGFMSTMGDQYLRYMGTLLDFGNSLGDLSSSSRISGLRHGFEMMLKRPILGVGPGCYPIARSMWFGWNLWAHNHYGQLMGDLGGAGTFIWFGFLYSYFKRALEFLSYQKNQFQIENLAKALISVTVVRLVLGMGAHSLYTSIWYIIAASIVAISMVISNSSKHSISAE